MIGSLITAIVIVLGLVSVVQSVRYLGEKLFKSIAMV